MNTRSLSTSVRIPVAQRTVPLRELTYPPRSPELSLASLQQPQQTRADRPRGVPGAGLGQRPPHTLSLVSRDTTGTIPAHPVASRSNEPGTTPLNAEGAAPLRGH